MGGGVVLDPNGSADGVACGSCGTVLRRTARFCDTCGAPTTNPDDIAKYRQVTVLFADVVKSMEIAAAVDVERLRDIMTELVERSATIVQSYGGTVEYNGDGVMAIFGAPIALEDHAFRGCLAALAIQDGVTRLAAEVLRRDGVALRLRVGLHSGRVIAGKIGSGALGYVAIGDTVGFAERMESVAPPGGVMVSETTANLVEHEVSLAEPEWVSIKGADAPVRARRLLAIRPRDGHVARAEASLVGRRGEIAALDAVLHRTVAGHGGVVNLVGPPGIGKSRAAREAAALAAGHGVKVVWAFCESHARDVAFHTLTRLLRAAIGMVDVDVEGGGQSARAHLRQQFPHADAEDLLLFDDLIGIANPVDTQPQIDADARRRRLTALITASLSARTHPVLYVIEDVHWVDAASESMIADLLAVISGTPSMVLITYRSEYRGALSRVSGGQAIALAPLSDSDTAVLLAELLGSDPSLGKLAATIAERAAGSPFFAEEMVRELAQRGVLTGRRGAYVCRVDVAEVDVPATVQATIAARIDRLTHSAKQTLNAASVIGVRFGTDLLDALGLDPDFDELVGVEMIDRVRTTPRAEYAFRHPLIRAVAYESQLKSTRAESHRCLAVAIQERAPGALEENAALIAEHLQAAGESRSAYGWHMRAAAWSATRDVAAGRRGWERARMIADRLPDDDPDQLSMRIAPRTMLCATVGWSSAIEQSRRHFAELRELCEAAGDKVSLGVGMTGLATELLYSGRSREGSRLVSEQMALLETIDDADPAIGLSFMAFCIWFDYGDFSELLRWTQTVVDLTDGDPTRGAGFGMGSPLASALAWRGFARCWVGQPGWQQDLHDAVAAARDSDPATFAAIIAWCYGGPLTYGMLRADDAAVRAIDEAVQAAEAFSVAIALYKYTLGVALLNREAIADRDRGLTLMGQARQLFVDEGAVFLIPVADLWTAQEWARRGGGDTAIPVMRRAVEELHEAGRVGYGVWATGVLVEALLERGADDDLTEAKQAIEWLRSLPCGEGSAIVGITQLRLHALAAGVRGDADHQDVVTRYRDTAHALGLEGHLAWAEAIIANGEREAM